VAALHPFVEDRVLPLDEIADMDILGQFRAGPQARNWPRMSMSAISSR